MSVRRITLTSVLLVMGLAACSGDNPPTATGTVPTTTPAGSSSAPGTPSRTTAAPGTSAATPPAAVATCADRIARTLTPQERAGQLLMAGIDPSTPVTTRRSLVHDQHVGNIVYLGGWQGGARVRATSAQLQREAAATGIGLLVAADQEGGQVQQLRGAGFTSEPSALQQGSMSPGGRRGIAATVGAQLEAAGVNVDLAPVADTVPASVGAANAPIGRYNREYGHTPSTVARAVTDVVHGLTRGGVLATVKHFPGIGRISANTDVSATGITDSVMTRHDADLRPFSAGITAGAGLVMVGFARYPRIDATHQAAFSHTIITGMLRDDLGYRGVVISDDLNAVAVRQVPVGRRAVRFIQAGGDIALTGATSVTGQVIAAIVAKSASDVAFAGQVRAAVRRVLALKEKAGLLSCD